MHRDAYYDKQSKLVAFSAKGIQDGVSWDFFPGSVNRAN